jgi:hypothetical protein
MKKLVLAAFLAISINASYAQENEVQVNLEWMFKDDAPPSSFPIWTYPVPTGVKGIHVFRGPLSAHSCLIYATAFALAGYEYEAMEWLFAGQAHNGNAQRVFNNNWGYTMDFLKRKYGWEAAKSFGLSRVMGVPYEWANLVRNHLRNHNPGPFQEPVVLTPLERKFEQGHGGGNRKN